LHELRVPADAERHAEHGGDRGRQALDRDAEQGGLDQGHARVEVLTADCLHEVVPDEALACGHDEVVVLRLDL
jgi:hypothetical protein